MKKILSVTAVMATLVLAFSTTSCTSYKTVPYFMNSDSVNMIQAQTLFDARLMPKDIITINVNCPEDADVARQFNLVVQTDRYGNNSSLGGNITTQSYSQMQYIISNEGYIDFPILGRLNVVGKTKTELEDYIASLIYPKHLKKRPVVTVMMANFKVSVLGEVGRPGAFTAQNGKMNILEALALAGDMTIWGQRDNVKVLREDAQGNKTFGQLNLNDANVIHSPYYQLQQNDVVYVTPNKVKAKNSGIGSETSLWFTSVSIVISMASLLYNILK